METVLIDICIYIYSCRRLKPRYHYSFVNDSNYKRTAWFDENHWLNLWHEYRCIFFVYILCSFCLQISATYILVYIYICFKCVHEWIMMMRDLNRIICFLLLFADSHIYFNYGCTCFVIAGFAIIIIVSVIRVIYLYILYWYWH